MEPFCFWTLRNHGNGCLTHGAIVWDLLELFMAWVDLLVLRMYQCSCVCNELVFQICKDL